MVVPLSLSSLQCSPVSPHRSSQRRMSIVASYVSPGPSEHAESHRKQRMSRREVLLATMSTSGLLLTLGTSPSALAAPDPEALPGCQGRLGTFLERPIDYSRAGPLSVVHLPRLESLCLDCSDSCAGTNCLMRIDVCYPKGGGALGLPHPYPLAIISPGFLVAADMYRSYAERLASWGYTVLTYDKLETVSDSLDDVTSVTAIRHLMDWATTDPLVRRVADASSVYLIGHSRGGKLSALCAAVDHRVAAVCLLDPVDNTIYAPLAPGYPSAVQALRNQCAGAGGSSNASIQAMGNGNPTSRSSPVPLMFPASMDSAPGLSWPTPHPDATAANCATPNVVGGVPVAIVGSGLSGDCAPIESNYRQFFDAAPGPTWEVEIKSAGHFEFLDAVPSPTTSFQRALCPAGSVPDATVRGVAQTVMVAWGELMLRKRTPHMLTLAASETYPQACIATQDGTFTGATNRTPAPANGPGNGLWGGGLPVPRAMAATTAAEAGGRVGGSETGTGRRGWRSAGGEVSTPVVAPTITLGPLSAEAKVAANAALERIVTAMRYDRHLAELAARYKNF